MQRPAFEYLEARQCLSVNPILLKDIHIVVDPADVDANGARIEEFYEYNDEVFFRADTGEIGSELWKTDGTPEGTVLVKDITPNSRLENEQTSSSTPRAFIEANGLLFFTADVSRDGRTHTELWRTDGTTAGTVEVLDLNLHTGASPDIVGVLGDDLYLGVGNSPSATSYDLWKVNGTENGSTLVKQYAAGTTEDPNGVSDWLAYPFRDQLYFSAADPQHGLELWKTDGTSDGTELMADINSGPDYSYPHSPVELNGELFFIADYYDEEFEFLDSYIFATTGEPGEVGMVSYMSVDWTVPLVVHNDLIYFTGNTLDQGFEPFRTDGTEQGTIMLADTLPGDGEFSGLVEGYYAALDRVFFLSANSQQDFDGRYYNTLWSTQGTPESTIQLSDNIVGHLERWSPVTHDGFVYFSQAGVPEVLSDSQPDDQLGRTDGTPAGTTVIEGPGDSTWRNAVPKLFFDDRLVLVGRTDSIGQEFWLFDPETETYEVIDVGEGAFSSVASASSTSPFAHRDILLASLAGNAVMGDELWALRAELRGDIVENGTVDFADFLALSGNYGNEGEGITGDVDGDGVVGFSDFLILSGNFGRTA